MRLTSLAVIGTTFIAAALLAGFTIAEQEGPRPSADQTISIGTYSLDRAHSSVGFRVRHLGISNVSGSFGDYDGSVTLDPSDLSTFQATAVVQVASIDTRNDRRDNHLRSDDFFAAEEYPTLTFTSTGVRNVDGNRFKIDGDLTIRGTMRRVVLDADLVGTAAGPDGSQRVAVEARTTIDRHDYGLNWSRLTEAGGVVVSRDVEIVLDIQMIRNEG